MILDLKKLKLRKVNEQLQSLDRKLNYRNFTIINPEGNHAVCAGLTEELNINIKGHVGLLLCRNESKSKYYNWR